MRNISGTEKFYEQKRCGSTISIGLYFYFSFIEKIILSPENRSLDINFARSLERGEFFDPAAQLLKFLSIDPISRSRTHEEMFNILLASCVTDVKPKITEIDRNFNRGPD